MHPKEGHEGKGEGTMTPYEQIASEVLQSPCYILQGTGQNFGRTHPRLDLYHEHVLREQSRWTGRRPAIEINYDAIKGWCEGDDWDTERLTLSTLAHEVAHVADRAPPYYDPPPSDALPQVRAIVHRGFQYHNG